MKIAVSGKGGSGKTTVTAGLIDILVEKRKSVVAVDCDPDISLGLALDFPGYDKIKPVCQMKELIAERTESGPARPQGFFKINPRVSDIPEKFCPQDKGIRLIVMGKVDKPQGGCLCPENTFVRSLLSHLILKEEEVVIMDMVAGSEHLGRATARGVDVFLIIVEPSQMSIQTARHIHNLSKGLGIPKAFFIANKIKAPDDIDFIKSSLGQDLAGSISFNKILEEARGKFTFDDVSHREFESIYNKIFHPSASRSDGVNLA